MIDPETRDLLKRLADTLERLITPEHRYAWKLITEARSGLAGVATPIEELGLSARVYNALKRAGYHYVEQLDGNVRHARCIGPDALEEIARAVRGADVEPIR
jgi:DNA-directed RNA polymerase alpha subunit